MPTGTGAEDEEVAELTVEEVIFRPDAVVVTMAEVTVVVAAAEVEVVETGDDDDDDVVDA